MSRDQQRLNDYITHILQAIERIFGGFGCRLEDGAARYP